MKTITLSSWKGGTGKTTLAAAAIKTLSNQGEKILVIDLDSNLSMTRIFNVVGLAGNTIDLLNGESIEPYQVDNNIYIFPSDLRISRISNLPERTLKNALSKLDLSTFDYVFIDPPGTMNDLTRCGITAADKIIIPAMPSVIDFEATGLVMEEMEMMGVEADVQIVLNGYDTRKNNSEILNTFIKKYPNFLYMFPIASMKSLKNLTADIANYSLRGRAKDIIESFVREVVA